MSYQRLTAEDLIDRAEIVDTVNRYATGIDRCDWEMYRGIFTKTVQYDFSSWSGAEPGPIEADDWVARVGNTLSAFDATQHVLTNHRVFLNGDEATCVAYMAAHHHFVSDTGERQMHSIGGYYTDHLVRTPEGWRIDAVKLTVTWEMGDRALFAQAAERNRRRPASAAER